MEFCSLQDRWNRVLNDFYQQAPVFYQMASYSILPDFQVWVLKAAWMVSLNAFYSPCLCQPDQVVAWLCARWLESKVFLMIFNWWHFFECISKNNRTVLNTPIQKSRVMLQVDSPQSISFFSLLHCNKKVPFPTDEYLIMILLKWLPLQTHGIPQLSGDDKERFILRFAPKQVNFQYKLKC